MADITAALVNELRKKTGAGMMDCKKALGETDGDLEKATDFLRKKGLAAAAKKSGRIAAEGLISSYLHAGGQIGVLVEVNCETDFVAKTEDFTGFVRDICLHIAAQKPLYLRPEDVPPETVAREAEIARDQAKQSGKPEAVLGKIVEGKISKYYEDVCLLNLGFVKDPDKKISLLLNELVAKIGENVQIRRFVRWEMGEGIEKKSSDFAAEVAAQVGQG